MIRASGICSHEGYKPTIEGIFDELLRVGALSVSARDRQTSLVCWEGLCSASPRSPADSRADAVTVVPGDHDGYE